MDVSRIDSLSSEQIDQLVEMFQHEWWSSGRKRADVAKMLEHSDEIVALEEQSSQRLLAFSRVLTDYVYKALVLDVVVVPFCRDLGLGKLLMEALFDTPSLAEVRHFELYCLAEVAPFYRHFGFSPDLGDLRFLRARRAPPEQRAPQDP